MVITEEMQDRLKRWAQVWFDNYTDRKRYHWLNWTEEHIQEYLNKEAPKLEFDPGNKYIRVWQVMSGQRSCHAFVNPQTGDVLKAASWKAPAKGVRFNLLDNTSFEKMLSKLDWAGGYLCK